MGTVPIVIFRGLGQSRAQGLGELGPPHFPVSRSAWYNPKLYLLYITVPYSSTGQFLSSVSLTLQYCN